MTDNDKDKNTKNPKDEALETSTNTAEESEIENKSAEDNIANEDESIDEPTAEQEVAELKDKLLRTLADMENLRRRSQKDRDDAAKFSAANFARDMLSVADNLRRATESIPEKGDPDGTSVDALIEGIALTEKELISTLERHGIQKIEPMGEKFDPQFHEAMYEIPSTEAESGTVMQVVEVGYVIHDRLLRPAKVGIAKAGPNSDGLGNEIEQTD